MNIKEQDTSNMNNSYSTLTEPHRSHNKSIWGWLYKIRLIVEVITIYFWVSEHADRNDKKTEVRTVDSLWGITTLYKIEIKSC